MSGSSRDASLWYERGGPRQAGEPVDAPLSKDLCLPLIESLIAAVRWPQITHNVPVRAETTSDVAADCTRLCRHVHSTYKISLAEASPNIVRLGRLAGQSTLGHGGVDGALARGWAGRRGWRRQAGATPSGSSEAGEGGPERTRAPQYRAPPGGRVSGELCRCVPSETSTSSPFGAKGHVGCQG